MLKRFEVANYRGFKDKIVFDLAAKDYEFNKELVKDSLVNKAILYGKNGVGKSNLGLALFDLISHLTDTSVGKLSAGDYINAEGDNKPAVFTYVFQFDGDEVIYSYKKSALFYLIEEELFFNGNKVLSFNYFERNNNFVDKSLQNNLQINLPDNRLSIVKYLYKNTPTDKDSLLYKMVNFVEHMLWYRSLSDGNAYIGYSNNVFGLTEKIYEKNKKDDFQKFLSKNGIEYNLEWEEIGGRHNLMVVFPNGNRKNFLNIISTGTSALLLFYAWSLASFDDLSLLFIDEFDAFLHYESSESLVKILNKNRKFQTILTSHNTYLMQNKLTRPDCCFIMTKERITSLSKATKKEIREAHNLEKMYINGAFVA